MEVACFSLADAALRAEYDALFEACPGAFVQQSTLWAEVIQGLGPDRPIFLLARQAGNAVAGLPLYVFESSCGTIVTSVPQAGPLGGIFCHPSLQEPERRRAYAELLEKALLVAEQARALALTLITNPFEPDRSRYEESLGADLVLENFTQHSLLDRPPEDVVLEAACRHANLARNLRRARAGGFRVEAAGWEALEPWYALHERRQRRLGAEPLPLALFEGILRVLVPRGKALFLVARDAAALASGAFYVFHRRVMDYFMMNMDEAYARRSPNYQVTETSLRLAAARGVRIFNWQSSRSRDDGVYRYKRQWGAVETPYAFVTRLLVPFQKIKDIGPAAARACFSGHYLVPFQAFGAAPGTRLFRK